MFIGPTHMRPKSTFSEDHISAKVLPPLRFWHMLKNDQARLASPRDIDGRCPPTIFNNEN